MLTLAYVIVVLLLYWLSHKSWDLEKVESKLLLGKTASFHFNEKLVSLCHETNEYSIFHLFQTLTLTLIISYFGLRNCCFTIILIVSQILGSRKSWKQVTTWENCKFPFQWKIDVPLPWDKWIFNIPFISNPNPNPNPNLSLLWPT